MADQHLKVHEASDSVRSFHYEFCTKMTRPCLMTARNEKHPAHCCSNALLASTATGDLSAQAVSDGNPSTRQVTHSRTDADYVTDHSVVFLQNPSSKQREAAGGWRQSFTCKLQKLDSR